VLGRSVTLNVLGQVGSLVLGFVASVALARWLGPSDRGLLAVMVSVTNLGLAVAGLGLPFAVMYFASRDSDSGALLGNSLLASAVLAAIFVPGFWLFRDELESAFGHGQGGLVWVLAAVLVPVTFLDWSTHNQLLGKLRFGAYNLLVVVSKLVALVAVIALVRVLDLGLAGGVLAVACGSFVVAAGSAALILGDGAPRLSWPLFGELLQYGRRVQIGTVLQVLNYRFDVVIVQFFRPLASVGYYVVAQILAELVIVLARGFQSSVVPLVAGSEGEARQAETTVAAVRHHGILAAAGIVANAVFSPLAITLAFGSQFHAAILPFFILLPGMWFLGTSAVVASDLSGRGRPGLASSLAAGAAVITVALDLALIPPFGVPGAAVASLVTYTAFGIASLIALHRVTGIPIRTLVVPERHDFLAYSTTLRRLFGQRQPIDPAEQIR
jgi:O-antigen/teichoic acid export membrane protein